MLSPELISVINILYL